MNPNNYAHISYFLSFVLVSQFNSCPLGLLHWYCGNHTSSPVPHWQQHDTDEYGKVNNMNKYKVIV